MSNRDAENTTGDNAGGGEDDVSGYGIPGLMPHPVPPPEVVKDQASDVRDPNQEWRDPPPSPDPPRMPPGVEGEKGGPAQW